MIKYASKGQTTEQMDELPERNKSVFLPLRFAIDLDFAIVAPAGRLLLRVPVW
jgi:hypothetical protein